MDQPWTTARLVAFDLEGTGRQDGDNEAILEVGVVPLASGHPDMTGAYQSLVNPGRRIQRRPWISPGLTNDALATAPTLDTVEPELAARLNDAYIVGHNVHVDWRLLSLRCPALRPAGLIDTLKLDRAVNKGNQKRTLTALLDAYELSDQVNALAAGGQAHRALWDAAGAGLLLQTLARELGRGEDISAGQLYKAAAVPLQADSSSDPEQISLL
ncbi:3'-5' exonuclease [Sphaerisporangium album]|uniref:3'-5' exonuclease n=1 Tax=Sphaerisporangium album TaxID=509200 RepID=A0A367EI82_9ACTN|nr:3'-5' exonuclease [Sphaerisporangium album]RCG17796.1 3'-5' exonuclease [Sphaerisporangium album]